MKDFNIIVVVESKHVYQDYERFKELHSQLEEGTGLDEAAEIIYPKKTHTLLVQNGLNILIGPIGDTPGLIDSMPILSLASVALYERGLLTDADLQGFEFTLSKLRNMFPANVKWVKFLMERNDLQYWYGTVDMQDTINYDNVI